MKIETVLSDIKKLMEAMSWGERQDRVSEDELVALKKFAIDEFARLNGWRRSDRHHGFDVQIQHGQGAGYPWNIFDHQLNFREPGRPYRPIAVVAQPYSDTMPEPVFGKMGRKESSELVWHAPPALLASIHFPGNTVFRVLTRPGVAVQWLPEQHDIERWKSPV